MAAPEHEGARWAWLTRIPLQGPMGYDDAARLGGGGDWYLREVLTNIADLAGWSAVVPFDFENPEHVATFRAVAQHLRETGEWLQDRVEARIRRGSPRPGGGVR